MKNFKRGEIYLCSLGFSYGSEQSGTRPAVVIQNDKGNEHSNNVIVAACTSKTKRKDLPTNLLIKSAGLHGKTIVQLSHIYTVDKSRLVKRLGSLTDHQMLKLNKCLKESLGV